MKYIRGFFMVMNEDRYYMQKALELAKRGEGFVNPNPMVGALIVKDGRIIGEGWHARYGEAHAERNAFASCNEIADGATLYVTLEPCCHYGKTPPCTEAIIEHKIARVVVAMPDPNPLMAGKGVEQLRVAGIEVTVGVEEEEASKQNKVFLKYITSGLPWMIMKSAMTLDGKIATCTGDSRWITSPESRKRVHGMRAGAMAVITGIGTIIADDPLLNVRTDEQNVRQPIRIVADSNARTPIESQFVRTASIYRSIVAHTASAPESRLEALQKAGVETLLCKSLHDRIDIQDLCYKLGKMKIDSLLIEGGGTLNYSFLQAKAVDEIYAFIAPKIIGGASAKSPVEGEGIELMNNAIVLDSIEVEMVESDLLVKGRIKS